MIFRENAKKQGSLGQVCIKLDKSLQLIALPYLALELAFLNLQALGYAERAEKSWRKNRRNLPLCYSLPKVTPRDYFFSPKN